MHLHKIVTSSILTLFELSQSRYRTKRELQYKREIHTVTKKSKTWTAEVNAFFCVCLCFSKSWLSVCQKQNFCFFADFLSLRNLGPIYPLYCTPLPMVQKLDFISSSSKSRLISNCRHQQILRKTQRKYPSEPFMANAATGLSGNC